MQEGSYVEYCMTSGMNGIQTEEKMDRDRHMRSGRDSDMRSGRDSDMRSDRGGDIRSEQHQRMMGRP